MPNIITKLIHLLLVLLIPILVIVGSARLLATEAYLAFEYGKRSFPSDAYGFTSQQRFELASVNVHYVRAHLPDDALAVQTLNRTPVYNAREVSHMSDVQSVFQAILRVWQAAFVLLLLLGFILRCTSTLYSNTPCPQDSKDGIGKAPLIKAFRQTSVQSVLNPLSGSKFVSILDS